MIDIQFEALSRIGLTPFIANQVPAMQDANETAGRAMRVVETQRDSFALHDGNAEHRARVMPHTLRALQAQGDTLTIGDWVLAQADSHDDLWITQRLASNASGAGKSTLTNTLTTVSAQDTGGIRQGDGRGRHTTTARSLHCCPEGACIIDTPGLRTWRPDAHAQALASTFEDVQLRDAQRSEQTPLERIAQRKKWKRLGKAGNERAKEKRR